MKTTNTATWVNENMSFTDQAVRIGLGLIVLFGAMQASISGGDAYTMTKLFATIVVLTGIAGWDPFYAMFRGSISRMTKMEMVTLSVGNISLPDRALRIGLGLAVLIASLQIPIGGSEVFPFIKLFATATVLTGIAGWDPLYAVYRKAASKLWNMRLQKPLAYPPVN